ncbi:hypothetical protein Btru_038132 [Bulinus truncatus]|nr:hypothetical protein Btru_038132 [Bulinus truncatus]
MFYQYSLIPAYYGLILCSRSCPTMMMAFTKPRTQKWLNLLFGRPGLVYPMDTLTRQSRLSYCAAFGATAFLVYEITLQQKFAIDYTGPLALKSLIAIVSMFIYGLVFFPIFTCLALRTAFGYGLGSLYIWMFFIIDVYSLVDCADDLQQRKARYIMRTLPSVVCRAFLSLSLPVRFVWAIKKGNYFTNVKTGNTLELTLDEVRDSYQGRHVRKLLEKEEQKIPPVGFINKIKDCLFEKIWKLIYQRQKRFRFPSRFVSVMFVSACVVYILTVEFLFFSLSLVGLFNDIIDEIHDFFENNYDESDPDNEINQLLGLLIPILFAIYVLTDIIYYSLIVATSASCALTLVNILHMTTSFRHNVYALYRGEKEYIPLASGLGAVNLCVGSIKYAGFQVAYFIWGYFITNIVLCIVCIALGIFIEFLISGHTDWLVFKVLQIWPGVLIGLVLLVAQKLLARFLFLQGDGKHLRLDNRRFYFVFTYFMFFYNIFLGIASCLLRIVNSIAVGILFLPRLDNSSMPRRFESFDPGFSAYKGYIHMEVAHTHPVVLVFIQILYTLSRDRKSPDSMELTPVSSKQTLKLSENYSNMGSKVDMSRQRNRAAQFNWFVIYTLLHNPTVRIYRKGFIQSMRKAIKEGLKMPISDMPITDFDLVKMQEEKDNKEKKPLPEPNNLNGVYANSLFPAFAY